MAVILRARVVLPVARPPIDDGAVLLAGNRIAAVGRWRELGASSRAPTTDLGEVILLPGLVNAHCHLDYTVMAGLIPPPRSFTGWITSVVSLKAAWAYSDYAQSWLRGAGMLLRRGVTTVADIEAVPELLPEVCNATPLRVFSFLELTGVKSRHAPRDIVREAVETIAALPSGRGGAGLSPHAPYSTTPELLRFSGQAARKRNWRLVIHVAESAQEFDMFMHRRGEMFDWLKNQRDTADCGHGSPVQHLARHGLLADNLLAVHVNYLGDGDAALLGERHVSVVHCPRSHAYFRHRRFPWQVLADAGVNICLGTDSLASIQRWPHVPPELDLFAEMKSFAANHPEVSPDTILKMATLNGAQALGRSGDLGELSAHALADLIAIPFSGPAADVGEAVVHHAGAVAAVMIDGKWVIHPQTN